MSTIAITYAMKVMKTITRANRFIPVLMIILTGITLTGLSLHRGNSPAENTLTPSVNPPAAVHQRQKPVNCIDTVLFTLTPTGIEPQTLELVEGQYFLAIDNLSYGSTRNLSLSRGNGSEKLHDVKLEGRKQRWRSFIDLRPGSYLISAGEELAWNCHLTVKSK